MNEDFDEWYRKIYKKSRLYKGIKIEGILFEEYWHKNYREDIYYKLKNIIKIGLGIFGNLFPVLIKNNFLLNENTEKIFLVMSFKLGQQNKIGEILENLKRELEKKDIILIVFDEKQYKNQKNQGYKVIYIKIPKYLTNLKNKKYVKWKYISTISYQLKIVDIAEKLINILKPKLIITTQDFYLSDYIFTMLGKKNKIKTISHLHGMILSENVGAYKYYYSDYVMVWGKRDRDILKKYIDECKIVDIGADKFRDLLNNRNNFKKKIVLCTTNIPDFYEHEIQIINEIKKIKFNGEKVIKIHPSVDIKKFKKLYAKILDSTIRVSNKYEEIESAKYLVTYKTTAMLDGIICGASIINIGLKNNPPKLNYSVDGLISYKKIKNEIEKRENNKMYFDYIMNEQDKFLNYTITTFNSSKRTKEFIENVLNFKFSKMD
ncbi:MAG: hypothetical protein ACRDBY_06730 [Cetobacterium sp.]